MWGTHSTSGVGYIFTPTILLVILYIGYKSTPNILLCYDVSLYPKLAIRIDICYVYICDHFWL